ncbi:MAG: 50S ribosomal protein L21 [bacterium]|nr:50S ribosomal protein L21 [bacterium]
MYAVIETGGKQYRVEPGDVLDVERRDLPEESSELRFDRVLMVRGDKDVQLGTPLVEGASVTATLVDEVRAPKIMVFKFKRRKGYRRLIGHRQDLMRVRIDKIEA